MNLMNTTQAEMAPGPAGSHPRTYQGQPVVGHLAVQASCGPQPVAGQLGFLIACPAQLTNAGAHAVEGSVQAVTVQGQPRSSVRTFSLDPGKSYGLGSPPDGSLWLVVDLSRTQVNRAAFAIGSGLAVTGGFALYGVYAAARDTVHRYRGKGRSR